jgi:hypothetical protein
LSSFSAAAAEGGYHGSRTMKKLANILRSNWIRILAVGVLVGITMLNAGCNDGLLGGGHHDDALGNSHW